MSHKNVKWFVAGILVVVLLLSSTLIAPAMAGETRSGKEITIGAEEVIPDDLYCFGETIVINGTVNGDLIAAGNEIRINGVIKGDVMAAAKTIVVKGKIEDDARLAGFDVQISEEGQINDDVNAAAFSFIARSGSQIDGDVYLIARQAELAGRLDGNLTAGLDALKVTGSINGNMTIEVSAPETGAEQIAPIAQFFPMSLLPSGLYVADTAVIKGKLTYTSPSMGNISSNAKISEQVFQTPAPETTPETQVEEKPAPEISGTTGILLAILWWLIDALRRFIALIIFALLLAWLLPIVPQVANKLQQKLWPSLGWGCLVEIAFFVAMPIIFVIIVGITILLGILTLGELQGYFISLALLLQSIVAVIFALITAYVTKVVVAHCAGRWLLEKAHSRQASGPIWPAIIGIVLFIIVTSIPVLGWIIGLVATLFGLGALWLWIREVWWPNRTGRAITPVAASPSAPENWPAIVNDTSYLPIEEEPVLSEEMEITFEEKSTAETSEPTPIEEDWQSEESEGKA